MNPRHPLYIVSKGRWESRLTSRALDSMGVPYHVVVEEQELDAYASEIPREKLLVLDPKHQDEYDTCDDLGSTKSKGPGAARNFAWEHAIASGFERHWVMDDNIKSFHRYNKNLKVPVADGTIFRCMEDFVDRYENVAMAGPNYFMFVSRKSPGPPFVLNTRIYSCNLILNSAPYRWRGRYNEDTDLSLRMLKDGWCTIQFNAFLQYKMPTQKVKGGNTAEFYAREGTLPKSVMQVDLHPDVSKLAWRFGRWHHYVDYSPFKKNVLRRRKDAVVLNGENDYGMELKQLDDSSRDSLLREKLKDSKKRFLALFADSGIDVEAVAKEIDATLAHAKDEEKPPPELQARWYRSLGNGAPDFGVYSSELYLAELWACWALYSRKYLATIANPRSLPPDGIAADIGNPEVVLDLGCGFGFTTAALTEMFPEAEVIGTNVAGTPQFKIAVRVAKERGFFVTEKLLLRADLVFASEYFEHFEEPIEELRRVLELKPKSLLVANAFSGRAIGHFDEYRVDGEILDGKKTARAFDREMRERGHEKVKTRVWNGRPVYWKRIEGA